MSNFTPQLIKRRRSLIGAALAFPWVARAQSASTSDVQSLPVLPHNASPATLRGEIPDVDVTSQWGEKRRFYTDLVKDRIVLINFMYVQCDGSCPITTSLIAELRKTLTEEFKNRLSIISITLSPEQDTPAELASYARDYGVKKDQDGLAPWHFLTGAKADLELLREALGFKETDPKLDQDKSQHASFITFGDEARGRWTTQPVGIPRHRMLDSMFRTAAVGNRRFVHAPQPQSDP